MGEQLEWEREALVPGKPDDAKKFPDDLFLEACERVGRGAKAIRFALYATHGGGDVTAAAAINAALAIYLENLTGDSYCRH